MVKSIRHAITFWIRHGVITLYLVLCSLSCQPKNSASRSVLHLSLDQPLQILDPRTARTLNDCNVLRFLFEGLTKTSKGGGAELALAKSVSILDNGLRYIFILHPGKWSNGDPVTAYDFEWSWKSVLDPAFPTDLAYQLYPIKNGRNCRMGLASQDEVGVRALDASTLEVELEKPIPYFLELLSMTSFLPVNPKLAASNLQWHMSPELFVSNGPFCLDIWDHANQVVFKKNPFFREKERVHMEKVEWFVVSADTALRMYEQGALDWIGSPFSYLPPAAVTELKEKKDWMSEGFAATYFYRINTNPEIRGKKNCLADPKFRAALSCALDRQSIVEHVLQAGQLPAENLVPPCLLGPEIAQERFNTQPHQEARALLAQCEPLTEPLVLNYRNDGVNAMIAQAVQSQWESVLGIQVVLEAIETATYNQRIAKEEYQIASGSWSADFLDPVNFLEVFKYRSGGSNYTGWENQEYIEFLDRSALCENKNERAMLLHQAEMVLMKDLPIIPIYHYSLNYLKKDGIQEVAISPMGQMYLQGPCFGKWNLCRPWFVRMTSYLASCFGEKELGSRSIALMNDSATALTAIIRGADGTFLGQLWMQPGEQTDFNINSSTVAYQKAEFSKTSLIPYTVMWQSPMEGYYSMHTQVFPGSLCKANECLPCNRDCLKQRRQPESFAVK